MRPSLRRSSAPRRPSASGVASSTRRTFRNVRRWNCRKPGSRSSPAIRAVVSRIRRSHDPRASGRTAARTTSASSPVGRGCSSISIEKRPGAGGSVISSERTLCTMNSTGVLGVAGSTGKAAEIQPLVTSRTSRIRSPSIQAGPSGAERGSATPKKGRPEADARGWPVTARAT